MSAPFHYRLDDQAFLLQEAGGHFVAIYPANGDAARLPCTPDEFASMAKGSDLETQCRAIMRALRRRSLQKAKALEAIRESLANALQHAVYSHRVDHQIAHDVAAKALADWLAEVRRA